ncbi:type IA DNA topoisomerase [Helicobacter rodentium]|uniref:type IA DNA topoisomerase n=1 Tax=Helicobacter rodentium TaxID=59617 RepID=UPI002357248F|nr:type IA DNA topoisomerase [Helicobacter rodentium]
MQLNNALIIIESPNKTKKIAEITGALVLATIGHFKGLTNEIVKDYESYEPILDYKDDNTKYRINQIINASKGKEVYIATDPDREGYGIGYMVYELIKNLAKSIKRAEFFEITESGIEKGIKDAIPFTQSNFNDYESWKARAVSDKLVGFLLSPKYMQLCNDKNNSIGRVQTPVLSLIVSKELQIQDFLNSSANKKVEYKIKAKLKSGNLEFSALGENLYEGKEEAQEILNNLSTTKEAFVFAKEMKEAQIKPKEPYRTSQFQEAMNRVYGFEPETSMKLAQALFEKGLITYHRTDSNALSKEFLEELQSHLKDKEYYQRREYKAGSQSQAEAHEAIRITHYHDLDTLNSLIDKEDFKENKEVNKDNLKKAYKLIYLNSIASQAKNAINENITYDFSITTFSFKAKVSKCIYKGFKEISIDNEEAEEQSQELNLDLNQKESVEILGFELSEVKKQAPKHYKESNFISLLEKNGIGRPSTYATYLPKLLERDYIEIVKKGKNSNIVATKKGIDFLSIVKKNDEWITQSEFTKQMESALDEISQGKVSYLDYIKLIHQKLEFAEVSTKDSNSNAISPPKEGSLDFAKKIAREANLELPEGIESDWRICQKFINENQNKTKKPASEKQISFAEKIAKEQNLKLPNNYKEDSQICSDFIAKNSKKKQKGKGEVF